MKKVRSLFALVLSLLLIVSLIPSTVFAVSETAFYVSPSGNDSNSGTQASPFKTITRAKDAVRSLSPDTGNCTVYLREGTYSQSNNLNFYSNDSGTANRMITYAAYPGEKPVITGRGFVFSGAQYITVEGLYFRDTNYDDGVQIRDSSYITVKDCSFYNILGGHSLGPSYASAVNIGGNSEYNVVYGNRIERVDGAGVSIRGDGDIYGNCFTQHNRVENNLITDIGRSDYEGAPGIALWETAYNYIGYNKIYNTPRYSINLSGNKWPDALKRANSGTYKGVYFTRDTWHDYLDKLNYGRGNIIEFNDCSLANTKSSDCGPIYFWGVGAGSDEVRNIVRNNSIHDTKVTAGGQWDTGDGPVGYGMYLDDGSNYFTIENNLIYNMDVDDGQPVNLRAPVMIKGENNILSNNIVANNSEALQNAKAGYGTIAIQQLGGEVVQTENNHFVRNIVYDSFNNQNRIYRFLDNENVPAVKRLSVSDYNIFYSPQTTNLSIEGMRYRDQNGQMQMDNPVSFSRWQSFHGFDTHSLSQNPQFYDAKNRDFRLRYTSPAYDLGFQDINMKDIGLKSDFKFADGDDSVSTVYVRSANDDVDRSFVSLAAGETVALNTFARTKDGYLADLSDAQIQYSVSNSNVASVSPNGVVTALGVGSAYVKVTVTKGAKTETGYYDIVVPGEGTLPTPPPTPTPTPTPSPSPTPGLAAKHEFYDTFEAGTDWDGIWIDENSNGSTRAYVADAQAGSTVLKFTKAANGSVKTYRDFPEAMITGDSSDVYTINLKVKPQDTGTHWRFKMRLGSNPDVLDTTDYEEYTLFSISNGKLCSGQGSAENDTGISIGIGSWSNVSITVDQTIGVFSVQANGQTAINNEKLTTSKYLKGLILFNNNDDGDHREMSLAIDNVRAFSGIVEPEISPDGNPIGITSLKMYSQSGLTELRSLTANSTVQAKFTLKNYSGQSEFPVQVIIAVYRSGGTEMVHYQTKTLTLKPGTTDSNLFLRLPADVKSTDYVRCMVWDPNWELDPYSAARSWNG